MAAPAFTIGNLQVIAQLTGTPGSDNPQNAGEFTPTTSPYTALFALPAASADTRKYGGYSGDLGYKWDRGDGSALTAYGDSYDANWVGPFSGQGGGAGNTTIATNAGWSLPFDLTTLTKASPGSVWTTVTTGFSTAPKIAMVRLQTGYFAYISFAGSSATGGAHLTGCYLIVTTDPSGAAILNAADVIKSQPNNGSAWTGLVDGTDFGHRDSLIFRSTDTNLLDGTTIIDSPYASSAGTAKEVVPGGNAGNTETGIFNAAITYTNITNTFIYATINGLTTGHGLVPGQFVKIAGDSVYGNTTVPIDAVTTNTASFFSGVTGTGSGGTIKAAQSTTSIVTNPKNATSNLTPPTGGVAVPGVGAGGATRQYLFYERNRLLSTSNALFNAVAMMGIAYSDDGFVTRTDVSQSGLIAAGSNGADISTLNTLVVSNALQAALPTSGVGLEVDTSSGLAYFSWSGKSGLATLTGVVLTRGTAHATLATNNGVRYMCWANNITYTGLHQQGWPWRPGPHACPADAADPVSYVWLMTHIGGRGNLGNGDSGMRMLRCDETKILDKSAWTAWNGSAWVTDLTAAANIFPDGNYCAEPSFYYHPKSKKYIASYCETNIFGVASSSGVVIRTAISPQGPWSDSALTLPSSSFGQGDMYGGAIDPWSNVTSTSGAVPTGPGGTVTTSISSGSQTDDSFVILISLAAPYCTFSVKGTIISGAEIGVSAEGQEVTIADDQTSTGTESQVLDVASFDTESAAEAGQANQVLSDAESSASTEDQIVELSGQESGATTEGNESQELSDNDSSSGAEQELVDLSDVDVVASVEAGETVLFSDNDAATTAESEVIEITEGDVSSTSEDTSNALSDVDIGEGEDGGENVVTGTSATINDNDTSSAQETEETTSDLSTEESSSGLDTESVELTDQEIATFLEQEGVEVVVNDTDSSLGTDAGESISVESFIPLPPLSGLSIQILDPHGAVVINRWTVQLLNDKGGTIIP